jgi:hypothetical protein
MALCSLSDVKTYLGISQSGDDALLQNCIDTARRAIISYCGGRIFDAGPVGEEEPAVETRYFNSGTVQISGRSLLIDYHELAAAPTAVLLDGTIDLTPHVKVYGNPPYSELILRGDCGYSWRGGGDVDAEDAIEITGLWGYSLSPPTDVKQAAVIWAAHLYQLKDAAPDGTMSALGSGSDDLHSFVRNIPSNVVLLLRPYGVKW